MLRGPPNRATSYREAILISVAGGLSAVRIHQDLVAAGAVVGYDSVRRFIRRLGATRSMPFRRIEYAAGEEAQVDFGTGAPIIGPDGKRRKTHVFRIVLSHSRTCRFFREARDVLLISPSGTDKSFLAQAIGYLAIKQG